MSVFVGYAAQERLELAPERTIYDAKRFIGRTFNSDSAEWESLRARYPFSLELFPNGSAYFPIKQVLDAQGAQLKQVKHT